jgi:hypothetical protein
MSTPEDTSSCLRWLHANLILSPGVSLSEEQLRQLSLAVGEDAVSSVVCVCVCVCVSV